MVRRNSSPAPLSHVSVTGRPTPSVPPPCWVQTVLLSGVFTAPPDGPTQPNSAKNGCGLPAGDNNTIGGDAGSTVSRYCVSVRSSIWPPLSEIEPPSRGVSSRTRGDAFSAASRESCWVMVGAAPWPDSCGCAPPGAVGAGWPDG